MPSHKEQIERLAAENTQLRALVETLSQRLEKLEASHERLDLSQSETVVRLEAVEENLCETKAQCQEIQHDQANIMISLESQQMYSRKQTLLISGEGVGLPERGEDTRKRVIQLLKEYLDIHNLEPHHICACHRLKNPKVILVRFTSLDDSDRVYRARTKPKKRGLMIFESLTAERLAAVHCLKELKDDGSSPVLSYYTQSGRIFVRTSESRETRPIEIPVGASKEQIRDMCAGKTVELTAVEICDQFRLVRTGSTIPTRSHRRQSSWSQVPVRNQSHLHTRQHLPQAPARASPAGHS